MLHVLSENVASAGAPEVHNKYQGSCAPEHKAKYSDEEQQGEIKNRKRMENTNKSRRFDSTKRVE